MKFLKNMFSWSKIVSDNIPIVEKEITVLPVKKNIVTPITSNFGLVMVSYVDESITRPKIVTIGRKLTKHQEFVKKKLNTCFKYRLNEFDSFKNGYINIDEFIKKMVYDIHSSGIKKSDVIFVVTNSYGKEFEFHPKNPNMICHILSKN